MKRNFNRIYEKDRLDKTIALINKDNMTKGLKDRLSKYIVLLIFYRRE
jgi:hypothetical protein